LSKNVEERKAINAAYTEWEEAYAAWETEKD